MIVYKCPNCGGEMSIDSSGALFCEFCGSKLNFSDKDLEGYKAFRSQMLNYLKNIHNISETDPSVDMIWSMAEKESFETKEGTPITINYINSAEDGHATMYVTRSAVLYLFPRAYAKEAELMQNGLSMLKFPEADIKGLGRCFPTLTGRFELKNGDILLSFAREATVFPLSIYGALPAHHVAWIISRMENIACVLEYSHLYHHDISINSIFINPVTHEAVLYGGWWNAGIKNSSLLSALTVNKDLVDIRKTAKTILGYNGGTVPRELEVFLDERPSRDAFDDFAVWDEVIEKGFGGRHFHKMSVDDNMKL